MTLGTCGSSKCKKGVMVMGSVCVVHLRPKVPRYTIGRTMCTRVVSESERVCTCVVHVCTIRTYYILRTYILYTNITYRYPKVAATLQIV